MRRKVSALLEKEDDAAQGIPAHFLYDEGGYNAMQITLTFWYYTNTGTWTLQEVREYRVGG
jgi:hypothetical protein